MGEFISSVDCTEEYCSDWCCMNHLSDPRFKRIATLVLGAFAGVFMVDCQYRPLEPLENSLEMGKIKLLQKYQRIREERRIRQMEWQEGIYEPQSKKEPPSTNSV